MHLPHTHLRSSLLLPLLLSGSLLLGCGAPAQEAPKKAPVWEGRDTDPYNFYRSVGYTLLRTRQYMKATQSIRRMVQQHPELPEPHYMMARAYLGMEQYEPARRLLLRAIERDDKYARAYAELGVLLDLLGRHKDADAAHHKAIELEPNNASYRNNLGFSLYTQGKYKAAVGAYLAALERDAAQKRIHNNLAFAYGKLGKLDLAVSHFKLAGPPAQASNNLGYLFEQRGELDRAYDQYALAVAQDGELIQARRNLERVSTRLGRPLPGVAVESTTVPAPTVSAAEGVVPTNPATETETP